MRGVAGIDAVQIILTVDPEIPVPPTLYGGIERIVETLVHGLQRRGHDVTLFANADSTVPCDLHPWAGASSLDPRDSARNAAQLAAYVLPRVLRGDAVVHSYARLGYMLPFLPLRIPKLQSYQRAVTPRSVRVGTALSRGTLELTACSAHTSRSGGSHGRWHVIYNCVDTDRYRFEPQVAPDAPLMFLGRLEPIKGPHTAIEVARRAGRELIVAGNAPESGPHVAYAREVIAQCDGQQIRYVGPVNDAQKNDLLGRAACLLMPIDWDEPFGIVMAEALVCGTPVIGFARGSVPEVVEDGVTGFHCRDVASMVDAVRRLPELQRAACRQAAEERFSNEVIVDQYEALYLDLHRRVMGRRSSS